MPASEIGGKNLLRVEPRRESNKRAIEGTSIGGKTTQEPLLVQLKGNL